MPHRTLTHFIHALEENKDLLQINAPVSPILEITEITDRVSKMHGKALLFNHVEGSDYPVLINAFGSYGRMSLALNAAALDDIGTDIARYLELVRFFSLSGMIVMIPHLFRLLCCFPIKKRFHLKCPECQMVVEREPDLNTFPALWCWPGDGGRFFTLPLVFTKDPNRGNQNVGMYRMQILDKNTTAMHWHKHKDGAGIYEEYRKLHRKMPVAVALGGDPAIIYSATAPLPPNLDEMMLAGFLRKRPVEMVKCLTCDIYVPENAEFILEGYVDPEEELAYEGPFGDHTGYYSLADWYPKFHVTLISHRRNPVFPATVVGRPPMEDCYMAKATERIFLPVLKLQIPELLNMNLPLEGVFHNCAIVSVRNLYPGAARTVMNAIWGMGQMRYTKMIVAVDSEVDPYDIEGVWEAVLTNLDSEQDLFISKGPLDALDHSSDRALYGSRLGVDATQRKIVRTGKGTLRVTAVRKDHAWAGKEKACSELSETDAVIILIVDDGVDVNDRAEVMWRVFNNIDASRDLYFDGGRVAVDATRKWKEEGLTRPWPEDIVMAEGIKDRVTKRWKEYGFADEEDWEAIK